MKNWFWSVFVVTMCVFHILYYENLVRGKCENKKIIIANVITNNDATIRIENHDVKIRYFHHKRWSYKIVHDNPIFGEQINYNNGTCYGLIVNNEYAAVVSSIGTYHYYAILYLYGSILTLLTL
jgi:hypothetical protein